MSKRRKAIKNKSGARRFFIEIALSIVIILASSLIMAIVAHGSKNSTASLELYALLALLISAAVSGFFISRLRSDGGVKSALLVALAVIFIMIGGAMIIFKGKITPASLMNYLSYLGVCLIFSYLGRKKEKRHTRRRIR